MGEVFLATDTRLDRKVAIKVLPAEFASDPQRLCRFEQEAKTLASLDHPNILSIFEIGTSDGTPYLVSQFLEGNTVREELKNGALPQRKALDYALQIAHGLAAAHAKGIIHRDLKPENIFVTKEGRVKILDFGLAKLRHSHQSQIPARDSSSDGGANHKSQNDPDASAFANGAADLPTVVQATEYGVVLGTAGYMSPEQVRGKQVDHRSDLFSLGCVLYELLSGQRAFRKETAVQTMNAILTEEAPELCATNPHVSPPIERLLHRCLTKDPENRFQSARDLAFAVETLIDGTQQFGSRTRSVRERRDRSRFVLMGVGLLLIGGLIGAAFTRVLAPSRDPGIPSIRHLTYSGSDRAPAVSADGKRMCFSSDRDGTNRIWIKELASGWEKWISDGPDHSPRFSPDGSMILFTRALGTQWSLFRMPSIGGAPSKIVDGAVYGDWSPDGRRVAFVRWPEHGGSEVHVAGLDGSGETLLYRSTNHLRCAAPRWSPDGKTIAVVFNAVASSQSIVLIDEQTREIKELRPSDPYRRLSLAAWDRPGKHLYYMQAESVSANSGGSPAILFRRAVESGRTERILWSPVHGQVVEPLPSGNVLFDSRSSRENLKELRLGSGEETPRSLTRGSSTDRQPTYSPDGQQIVFSSNHSGNLELWSISRATGEVRRLTDHPADDWDPAFSPDGKWLIWSSSRSGNLEVWKANADGSGPRQVSHDGFNAENPAMSPDGRWIVYGSNNPQKAGLWKIHPDGTEATHLRANARAGVPEISPDGKLVAYVEDAGTYLAIIRVLELDSGAPVPFEIRVEAQKESAVVLGRARWMPDGKALAFLGPDERGVNGIYVQDFVPDTDTSSTRRPLGGFDPEHSAESFGISPDGKHLTIAAWEQFYSIMMAEELPLR